MSEQNMQVPSSWFLEQKLYGDRKRLCIGVTPVGRQAGSPSAIYINSGYVSRRHAEITVDKNDKIVLKDLNSINGTFVNGTKIQNDEITLKANDCIGVGVTDDSEPDFKHPIYKLIYAPLPRVTPSDQNPNITRPIEEVACGSNVASGALNLKGESALLSISEPQKMILKDTSKVPSVVTKESGNGALNEPTTNAASVVKDSLLLPKVPTLFSGEIIVLSDDEDDVIHPIKVEPKRSSNEENSKDNKNIQASAQSTSNKVDNTPSQLSNDAAIHEPILPDVKREYVRSCTKNVVDIFGGADDVILESVKEINPLVYSNLNGKKDNRALYNGDKIDLSSDIEDGDHDDEQNVESFGKLVVEDDVGSKVNEDILIEENKAIKNTEIKNKNPEKSPNLFDSSLNTSNDLEEENGIKTTKNTEDTRGNQEIHKQQDNHGIQEIHGTVTDDSTNVAEELAEFVDMDDDMMFSQILINDMKSEMMADNNEEFAVEDEDDVPNEGLGDKIEDNIPQIHIKEEPIDELPNASEVPAKQNQKNVVIENDVWIITDDDEYDEELEHKVSDWSTKLLSQKMNMSQVFELPNDKDINDENKEEEEGLGLLGANEDLDDFFNESLVEDVIATLAKKTGENYSSSKSATDEQQIPNCSSNSFELGISKELPEQKVKTELKECSKEVVAERKSRDDYKGEPTSSSSSKISHNEQKSSDKRGTTIKEKDKVCERVLSKPVKRLHHPPSVIDAPNLPKHKGKHRGVSAEIRSPAACAKDVRKKALAISGHLKEERYKEEMKKKWHEKPSEERRRDKEKKRQIKESRKERLKELADKQAADSTKIVLKRRHTPERETTEKKKAKVKITTMNRGALLAEDIATKKIANTYKIPKTKRSSSDSSKIQKETCNDATASTSKFNNTKLVDAFALEMSKVDIIIRRRLSSNSSSKSLSRSSSTEDAKNIKTTTETKMLNAPVRKTNKITFASMQKNFIESRKNQELLENLASHRSCLIDVKHRNANKERQKKRVRFNETPIVHYIERINGANKRVDRKDILPSPNCSDRACMLRLKYAMVDKTAQIISQILGWSNEWLVNRNAHVDAASDILLPMPNQFSSFNHYKSIIIPLMKLEFISVLEREKAKCKTKTFNVLADQVSPHMDRFIIVARHGSAKNSDTRCELVVLEWGRFTTFAYMSSQRLGISTTTIVYEVLANDLPLEELRANLCNSITVRPMIDIVRVEFGAFNAIYQLEQSPLLNEILDPMELFKLKPFPKSTIAYCGFDDLNQRQKDVVIHIYRRAIEPTPSIALIQGPPGTGKSCVIANLVHQLLYGNEVRILDQKVLICAQSNAAVDAIAEKLFYMSQKKLPDNMFRLIRFGLLERINPRVQHATLPKIIERNQIRKLKTTYKNLQIDDKINIKEYLRNEIVQLEADIEHMKLTSIKGTVQEEQLLEKHKQVQLMRNIVNGVLRPEDERSLYNWHLMHANVVCTTLSSCVKLSQYVNYFDICIVDEATQCTEPWTLMPLKFGINTLVLVGDTQQLPATVLSKKASDFGLGTSLFTRIQQCIESVTLKSAANRSNAVEKSSLSDSNKILFSLQTQYRMHPEICKWPNSYFYKNELIDDPKTHQFKTPLKPFSVLNLTYTQDNNCNRGQIVNELEAKFVARLVKTLDCYIPMKYNSFGVITPYAQQRGALEKALCAAGFPNVTVNTIDSYQGTERDVIIISNARTTGIGFLSNYQRLNVALTRPKKCLILCGNLKNLELYMSGRTTSAGSASIHIKLPPLTRGIGRLANTIKREALVRYPDKTADSTNLMGNTVIDYCCSTIIQGEFIKSVPAWRSLLQSARERKLYHELSADCMDDMHRNVIPKIKYSKPTEPTAPIKEPKAHPSTNEPQQ